MVTLFEHRIGYRKHGTTRSSPETASITNGSSQPGPQSLLLERLECSTSTFKRLLELLRDRYQAPIVWDRAARGYRYDTRDGRFTLPGVWLTESEAFALLMANRLLHEVQPGLQQQGWSSCRPVSASCSALSGRARPTGFASRALVANTWPRALPALGTGPVCPAPAPLCLSRHLTPGRGTSGLPNACAGIATTGI